MRIYVHVPFCRSKCHYCNFYSLNTSEDIPGYLSALKTEFRVRSQIFDDHFFRNPGNDLDSVYIGGGTPSVLSDSQFEELLGIFDSFSVKEFTVEMNPETVTAEKAVLLRKHGVNRVSLGVQSTKNDILARIGRTHRFETVPHSLQILRDSGISNISIDFITGFSGQEKTDADKFVEIARRFARHISVYSLEYEGKIIKVMDEDAERDLFDYLKSELQDAGFHRYEISNFALDGYESAHNTAYWNREPYLGLGPGAASFDGKQREENAPDLPAYLHTYRSISEETDFSKIRKRIAEVTAIHPLTERDVLIENLILPLRTSRGISAASFLKRHGVDLLQLQAVSEMIADGFMVLHDETNTGERRIALSDRGMDIANAVYLKILQELERISR